MNIKNFFLLIFFIAGVNIYGQTITSKFFNYPLKIDITEEMDNEMVSKGITKDKVFISFDMTPDCKIENYKVTRPGELKSFTLEVEKQKEKIIKQLQKQIECESGKLSHYQIPIMIKS